MGNPYDHAIWSDADGEQELLDPAMPMFQVSFDAPTFAIAALAVPGDLFGLIGATP